MSVTRVFLVRHGATVLSAEDRFAGSTNVELSDEGRRQARALGERLRAESIDAVYASPMDRAIETARLASGEPTTDTRLREIDHGRWEGLRRADVEQKFPGEYAAWETDPFAFAPEGGESGVAVMARAIPVLREIVIRHGGSRVLVVSHKATIRLLLASFLGIDPRGYRDRLDQLPCAVNLLDFKDPARARLMLFNDVSHYASQTTKAEPRLSPWFV